MSPTSAGIEEDAQQSGKEDVTCGEVESEIGPNKSFVCRGGEGVLGKVCGRAQLVTSLDKAGQ
jgi:hypothetical protein